MFTLHSKHMDNFVVYSLKSSGRKGVEEYDSAVTGTSILNVSKVTERVCINVKLKSEYDSKLNN